MNENGLAWFEDHGEDTDEFEVDKFDITVTPNDFNVMTLNGFVESGAVRIPAFQRNYVWDLRRASKLIESLILGLPVPQLFLYEQERNKYLVIDGQQRLMSIYYFFKQRFPRKERRGELRSIFDHEGRIPDRVLHDDDYFKPFNLRLHDNIPKYESKLKDLNYSTLGPYKTQFDLRPIRNIVVRQNMPSGDDSSIYEIFSRLNTGGISLKPQEIRTSMYHSGFYNLLYDINTNPSWRRILGLQEPDIHMRDIEFLLRGFAILIDGKNYSPSMIKFLNQFSLKCKNHNEQQNQYCRELFESFLRSCSKLPDNAFKSGNNRFNVTLYEAVFAACCEIAYEQRTTVEGEIQAERIRDLEKDADFIEASREGTTQTANVIKRLDRARELVGSLNIGVAS